MPIPRIYPHYPKPNPTPPLKRRDLNTAFQQFATSPTEEPPTKKMAVIETEPILTENIFPTLGARLITPAPYKRCNEDAWRLVSQITCAEWGYSTLNISTDHFDSLEIGPNGHRVFMTIMCDHGTKQGVMAKNITDNFAREIKPQQLRQFLNRYICKHDNADLFHLDYVKKVFMQEPEDFHYYNLGLYSPEEIGDKINWVQKWTRAEHRTFTERFVAFAAAEFIFGTTNRFAIHTFEINEVFPGLVLAAKCIDNQDDVLEDFIELVHQELLIRPASPLTIREIVRDAYDYELNYAESIVKNNDYLNFDKIVENLKDNTNKTLRILGQPPYFHTTDA
jgi:hypothetical protein